MGPRARLTLKNDPLTFYETYQEEFLIGRSKDCEIVIKDPAVSQLQARVRFQNEIFIIENLGRNPTRVNGIPVETQSLHAGDQITVGRTELLFHVEEEVNGVQMSCLRLYGVFGCPAGKAHGKHFYPVRTAP